MKSQFIPIKLVCTALGAGALFIAAPFAEAARPSASLDRYDGLGVEAEDVRTANDAIHLAQRVVVIERDPEIRVIRPEQEIRVRIEPPGSYKEQKVLVKPGHFEEYRVWIPERFDPEQNATFHGHYETRQRWVPDVYEYRKVWVPSR